MASGEPGVIDRLSKIPKVIDFVNNVRDETISPQALTKRVRQLEQALGCVEEVESVAQELADLGLKYHKTVKCPKVSSSQFCKFDLDHIFSPDMTIHQDGKVGSLGGFHHDFKGKIQEAGNIIFKMKTPDGPFGTYEAYIGFGGRIKPSSFFPRSWSRGQVMEKIVESFEDIIVKGEVVNGSVTILGATREKMVIETVFQQVKEGSNALMKIKSCYPNLTETLKLLNG